MEQLTIKELAPYLPYKILVGDGRTPFELTEHNFTNVYKYIHKLYLRPLSDLIKEIEVNGEKFRPAYRTQLYMNDKYLPLTINGRIVLENRIVTNTILYT